MSSMLITGAVQFATYSVTQATLVVGDGDFSYSRGLAAHRGSGHLLIATSYDSAADIEHKYGSKVRQHEQSIRACSEAGACARLCRELCSPTLPWLLYCAASWCIVLQFLGRERLTCRTFNSLQEDEDSMNLTDGCRDVQS